jgi:transcriptional regulator with XRE-family HTH domain
LYDRALKLIREYHRLSQFAAADKLEISNSYLSEIENGKKQPSLYLLEKYSSVFDIPLSSILLFAELSSKDNWAEHFRGFAADKILKILEWIQLTSDVSNGRVTRGKITSH